MQSRGHGHALLEALFHLVARKRRLEIVGLFVLRSAEAREDDSLAIERDLEIVLQLETANDVDRLAIETWTDHVLAVNGEVVTNQDAAASADRKSRHVIVLREVATHAEGFERGCDRWTRNDLRRNLPGR